MTPINIPTLNYLQRVTRELEHLKWKFLQDADDAKQANDFSSEMHNQRRADRTQEMVDHLYVTFNAGNQNLNDE